MEKLQQEIHKKIQHHDWQFGDVVKCIEPTTDGTLTVGMEYRVEHAECTTEDPLVYLIGLEFGYFARRFEFIRRP